MITHTDRLAFAFRWKLMSENTDHRAEYGYQPHWTLQRMKQDEHASRVHERRDKKEWEKKHE